MDSVESLKCRRAAVVLFSYYPGDPRPRRAAEALVKEGMCVELLCLREHLEQPRSEVVGGVKVSRVPLRRRRGGKLGYVLQYSLFILIASVVLAFRSLRRRYDFIHVHNMPDVLVVSALIPRLLGAKVVLDLHDPMPELMTTIFNFAPDSRSVRLLKQFEKWSIRLADVVVTVNLACKRIFSARSCSSEKVQVVMNSPDEGIFGFLPAPDPRRRNPDRPFVIMYHGSIVERHGLDLAVQALEAVRRSVPTAELRIYGHRSPFCDSLMGSVKGTPLQDAIRYFGAKDLPGIVRAIDECDVGVIPNRRSVFTEINTPTRIFEYLSRGKPVIAPRAQGIEDYFAKDDLIYFELGDAIDLARKIKEVYFQPHLVKQIVERGQQVYLAHRWSQEKLVFVGLVRRLFRAEQAD